MRQGYILTRQVKDIANRMTLSLWVKTMQGAVNIIVNDQRALFFIKQMNIDVAQQLREQE